MLSPDEKFMRLCMQLARKGRGKVSPNPLAGSLLVQEGRIIAKGWHQAFGAPHAEAMALKSLHGRAPGATLYCNLEPCCHTDKKTPPCLPLILASGVKRVVIANRDPNPRVAGRSIEAMRSAGIEVTENVLAQEGEQLNRFFFRYITDGRPWVAIKIARTLDGRIGKKRNRQSWISGPQAGKFVHRLRAEFDAVLIGAGTVNADDPQLTVRHVRGRSPLRLVLDGCLTSNPATRLFSGKLPAETWLLHAERQSADGFKKEGVKTIAFAADTNGHIALDDILKFLSAQGIASLLVEGGAHIFSAFIQGNHFDELFIIQSPDIWGTGLSDLKDSGRHDLQLKQVKQLGRDLLLHLYPKV